MQQRAVGVPVTVWRDLSTSPSHPHLPHAGLTLCHWKAEGNHRAGGSDRAPGAGQRRQDHPAEEPRLRGREHHHTDAGDGVPARHVLWHRGQFRTRLKYLQTPISGFPLKQLPCSLKWYCSFCLGLKPKSVRSRRIVFNLMRPAGPAHTPTQSSWTQIPFALLTYFKMGWGFQGTQQQQLLKWRWG